MIWLLWFFVSFSLVLLITREKIFEWPRKFAYNLLGEHLGGPLACAPCAAFWVGVGVGVPDLGIFAQWLPLWAISSAFRVAVVSHLLGGLLLISAVELVQFLTHTTIAQIAAEVQAAAAKAEAAALRAEAAAQPRTGPAVVIVGEREDDEPDEDEDRGGHA